MAKKREKPKREITKRQLARWQQQRRRQRILFGAGVSIIAAALIIVGAGWYIGQYHPLHEVVISINGANFNMDYYTKTLRFYGEGRPAYYVYNLTDQIIEVIEQNELIRQGAAELGISVSQAEVDEELRSRGYPLNQASRDIVRVELLRTRLLDEYFDEQVPVYAEQRHIMAMFLESESQVNEVKTSIEAGEVFADLAGELSLESLSQEEKGDLGWRPRGVLDILLGTTVVDDYAFNSTVGALSPPLYDEEQIKSVGYWIAKVLERNETPEEAAVLGILLGSKEEAQEVKARLDAGEDFATLAEEFSKHVSADDGGDLGWFTPGEAGAAFDGFVFNHEIELDVVSEPIFDDTIASDGGYWLLKVAERKEKQEKADIQVMLLGSAQEAQEIKTRLEAGEDFATLAQEFSQYQSGEGSGKVTDVAPDTINPTLGEFVFNPGVELEAISQPIRDDAVITKGGYWLVQVVEQDENRQIEDSDRELLKAAALSKWIEALWDDPNNKIENSLDAGKKAWAADRVIEG